MIQHIISALATDVTLKSDGKTHIGFGVENGIHRYVKEATGVKTMNEVSGIIPCHAIESCELNENGTAIKFQINPEEYGNLELRRV